MGNFIRTITCDTDSVRAIRDGYQTCIRTIAGTTLYDIYPCTHTAGDIVGIKESWDWEPCATCPATEIDDCVACDVISAESYGRGKFLYEATSNAKRNWRKAADIPKEAIRTYIRITSVRMEPLQNITEQDALREGYSDASKHALGRSARDNFRVDWDNHMTEPAYGWDANPLVYVLDFELYDKPVPTSELTNEKSDIKFNCDGL